MEKNKNGLAAAAAAPTELKTITPHVIKARKRELWLLLLAMTFPRDHFLNGEICNPLCAGDCKEVLIACAPGTYTCILLSQLSRQSRPVSKAALLMNSGP
jgi:hypothetical protein